MTLDNLANILAQISVTGVIAVGLTFVILCGEIDLSVASIANVIGVAVAFFTLQESYVNIANISFIVPGGVAIVLALVVCAVLGLVNAFGVTMILIPSFIMTLAMMQIADGICAVLLRGQIAYAVPDLVTTLGSGSIGGVPWIVIVSASSCCRPCRADLYAVRPIHLHGRRQPRGGRVLRHQHQDDPGLRDGDLGHLLRGCGHDRRRPFR